MPFSSSWCLLEPEPVRRLAVIGLQNRHASHSMVAVMLKFVESIERKDGIRFEIIENFVERVVGTLMFYLAHKSSSSEKS